MADHRAEQILVALTSQVTGLTTTQARVYRGRAWPLDGSDIPALLVYMVQDRPAEPGFMALDQMDSILEVVVEARVKTTTVGVDTALNAIRKEVEIAVLGTPRLGLPFVIDTRFAGMNRPDRDADIEQPTGAVQITFEIHYRRSYADPTQ